MPDEPADPTFYLLKSPHFPPAELMPLLLGRIVKNYASPFDDFTPQDPRKYLDLSPNVECKARNVSAVVSSAKEGSLGAKLTGIAEFSAHRNASASTNFETSIIRSVRVTSHSKAFKKLMEDEEVVNELKSWLNIGGTAYLIVGVCIWEDAKMDQKRTTDKGVEGSVTEAAGTVAAVMGGVPPTWMNGIGDLVLDPKLKEQMTKTISAETEGNSIFAIECRKVIRYRTAIFKGFPPERSDDSPRYPPARTLGDRHKEKALKEAPPQEQAQDKIQADFSEKLDWTHKLKGAKVVEADGYAFAFEE